MNGSIAMLASVWLNGNAVLVQPEVMTELGLHEGQVITEQQFGAVIEGNLRSLELEIEQRKHPN